MKRVRFLAGVTADGKKFKKGSEGVISIGAFKYLSLTPSRIQFLGDVVEDAPKPKKKRKR